jgi:predicted flavoprotein YhiN
MFPCAPGWCRGRKTGLSNKLEGLSLRNIRLKFSGVKSHLFSGIGEMVFTSSGISGPLVFSVSAKVTEMLAQDKDVSVEIDLKPALSAEQLDNRLLREFKSGAAKSIKNVLKELLPLRGSSFIDVSGIGQLKKCSQITQKERGKMVYLLKGFRMDISCARPIEEGMVTRGGVSLKRSTRARCSPAVKGLFFCGK